MALFDPERVRTAANADTEFRQAARFWDGDVRITTGATAHILSVRGGVVEAFGPAAPEAPSVVVISAAESEWEKFLEPVPRAFYQGLFAATGHHGFTMTGDLEAFLPYYAATARLFAIMRAQGAS